MVDDQRTMYDRFSGKGAHPTEWFEITKNFLKLAFAGDQRVRWQQLQRQCLRRQHVRWQRLRWQCMRLLRHARRLFAGQCGMSSSDPTPSLHISVVRGGVLLLTMRMLRTRKNMMVMLRRRKKMMAQRRKTMKLHLVNQNLTLGEPNSSTMPKSYIR
jgi:hypothetical protein